MKLYVLSQSDISDPDRISKTILGEMCYRVTQYICKMVSDKESPTGIFTVHKHAIIKLCFPGKNRVRVDNPDKNIFDNRDVYFDYAIGALAADLAEHGQFTLDFRYLQSTSRHNLFTKLLEHVSDRINHTINKDPIYIATLEKVFPVGANIFIGENTEFILLIYGDDCKPNGVIEYLKEIADDFK